MANLSDPVCLDPSPIDSEVSVRYFSLLISLVLLAACDYEAPLDPRATTGNNSISGTVVLSGFDTPSTTIVLIYDATNPPPPAGTGRPITFSTVAASSYNTDIDGLLAASYTVTGLADGLYLATALVDIDEDFHPLVASGALGGSTCGDWLGAYISDVETQELTPIEVAGGEYVDQVTIAVASEVPFERPAYAFTTPALANRQQAIDSPTVPQLFSLNSISVASELGLELTGPFDGTDLCDTAFIQMVYDLDVNGVPDPHPEPALAAVGALNIWPKAYVQYVGVPQEDGSLLSELPFGESVVGEAIVYPDFLASGVFPLNTPVPATSINYIWVPAASHRYPDGTSETITIPTDLPAGVWAVTLVSITGQTWTLPNELANYGSLDVSFDPATQAGFLSVE